MPKIPRTWSTTKAIVFATGTFLIGMLVALLIAAAHPCPEVPGTPQSSHGAETATT